MKKLISAILILALLPVAASAKSSFSSLTDEELIDMIYLAADELTDRSQGKGDAETEIGKTIPVDNFLAAASAMADKLEIAMDTAEPEFTAIDWHYTISSFRGIRLVCRDGRVAKASVKMDVNDGKLVIHPLYYLASIFEGRLYEKDFITDRDLYIASYDGRDFMNYTFETYPELLNEIFANDRPGLYYHVSFDHYPNYRFERMDNAVWLSAVLADLPEGIY